MLLVAVCSSPVVWGWGFRTRGGEILIYVNFDYDDGRYYDAKNVTFYDNKEDARWAYDKLLSTRKKEKAA